jgi:hypothetical protein
MTIIFLNEEFHPINTDEFPDYYISCLGDILSTKKGKMRLLNPYLNNDGYYHIGLNNKNGKQCNPKFHRLLAKVFIDNPENKPIVDHIDGCRTNNTLSNLRWCTWQENTHNKVSQKNSSSKFKGVSYFKRDKKWRARIHIDGKSHCLGLFKNEYDAHLAYDKKARETQGEFYHPLG